MTMLLKIMAPIVSHVRRGCLQRFRQASRQFIVECLS